MFLFILIDGTNWNYKQGTVSFLNKWWGGRASDKQITENNGLIQHLEPGDIIIADHGFMIDEYCCLAFSEVCIPPFNRGKVQFTCKEETIIMSLSLNEKPMKDNDDKLKYAQKVTQHA